jgi:hypothetical protein
MRDVGLQTEREHQEDRFGETAMLGHRKQNSESLPWYRNGDYKGALTEVDKRKLDAFRSAPTHPSTRYENLPDEVQRYIAGMESQIYDLKQEKAAAKPILCTLAAIALLCLRYRPLSLSSFWVWVFGLLLILVPWFVYRHEWNRNAKEFMLESPGSAIDEAILREWEVSYVARNREPAENNV